MPQVMTFRRLAIANGVLGVLLGAILALTGHPAEAEAQGSGGCKCTISGKGAYACTVPNGCFAGAYNCSVSCKT